jgi:hypothetical protein
VTCSAFFMTKISYNTGLRCNGIRFIKYYEGDEVNEDGRGGTCSTNGVDEKCVQNFDQKT